MKEEVIMPLCGNANDGLLFLSRRIRLDGKTFCAARACLPEASLWSSRGLSARRDGTNAFLMFFLAFLLLFFSGIPAVAFTHDGFLTAESGGKLKKQGTASDSYNFKDMSNVEIGLTLLSRYAKILKDYEDGLDEVAYGLLDPSRLAKDTDLSESVAIITKMKILVKTYESSTRTLYQEALENLKNIDDSTRGLEAHRKISPGTDGLFKTIEIEVKIVDTYEEIIRFLMEKNGTWIIEDKMIAFENAEDMDVFNSYTMKVRGYAEEQQQLAKDALTRPR